MKEAQRKERDRRPDSERACAPAGERRGPRRTSCYLISGAAVVTAGAAFVFYASRATALVVEGAEDTDPIEILVRGSGQMKARRSIVDRGQIREVLASVAQKNDKWEHPRWSDAFPTPECSLNFFHAGVWRLTVHVGAGWMSGTTPSDSRSGLRIRDLGENEVDLLIETAGLPRGTCTQTSLK